MKGYMFFLWLLTMQCTEASFEHSSSEAASKRSCTESANNLPPALDGFSPSVQNTHKYVVECYDRSLRARESVRKAIQYPDQDCADKAYLADLAKIKREYQEFFDATDRQFCMLFYLKRQDQQLQLSTLQKKQLEDEKRIKASHYQKLCEKMHDERELRRSQSVEVTEVLNKEIAAQLIPAIEAQCQKELCLLRDNYKKQRDEILSLELLLKESLKDTVVTYLCLKVSYDEAVRLRDARMKN